MTRPANLEDRFALSDMAARELANEFGTPLYVVDETHLRHRIRKYIEAFRSAYAVSELSFASKANSTLAILAIAYDEGCVIDVASEGELEAALRAGVPANRCHFHGNNKRVEEIARAVEVGVGQIVVDSFEEIDRLALFRDSLPPLIIRLAPGVDPKTHAKISTGQADTKFGFNISDGSAERAVVRLIELGVAPIGFHCHVGSQLLDPEAQRSGGFLIAEFARQMHERHHLDIRYLNVGGGLGVRYTEEDQPTELGEYNRMIVEAILEGLGPLLRPTLGQEPGRSLVAESGVTLYSVGAVKQVAARTYVSVDGGLSDNPRPALYGSVYPVRHIATKPREVESESKFRIAGKHCESDMLFDDVSLPRDVQADDLIQVLCTGAYNASMASNYNRYPRPKTVLIRSNGEMQIIQRSETWDEMFSRETVPNDLRTTIEVGS
ncbi:MAG: diaminopimelate decarboxylase [Fimbriimonadaceae bacterium]|nr:diaminopimelate decarboxylase [Fimbriimonadaceae bacterium]